MQDADFPYSVPIRLHTDQSDVEISARVVMFLPTNKITNDVVVLIGTRGSAYDPGLYITTNGKTWRFIAPFAILNRSVYRGYEVSVYAGLTNAVAPAPSSFLVYKNGVETELISPIPANDSAVYVTVRSIDASLDENGKIPMDQLPDAIKGGLRWAGNTAPYSGFYDAAAGEDTGTGQQIPDPSSANSGMYWVVTVAGTQWGYDLTPGDWLVSNGTSYQWVDGGAQPVASYTNRGVVQIRENAGLIIDANGMLEVDPTQTGGVKTVNGQSPDASGNVLVNTGDIPGLQALLDSKVKQVNAVLPVNGVLTLVAVDIGALDVALRGAANGVASLDADGTVPISQLPAAILGALRYQSAYDASTNTPPLPTPDAANRGFYWVVNVAGTQVGHDLKVGDWVVSNGASYDVIDNQNTVSMVNGQTGIVVLKVLDIEGAVASVNGALPNAQGEVTVPVATESVAGTVKIPSAGGLTVAPDGALSISAELLKDIGFTPIRVLYVALNGDPALGNGKINNPFTTISDAVTAAVDGTAIVVMTPGTFVESVQIINKQIALLSGLGSAHDQAPITIDGFLKLGGSKPISVQNLRLSWSGIGAGFRVFNASAKFAVKDLVISTSAAAQAVQIDASEGAWTGDLVIDGLYTNDGKVQVDAGTVSIRLAPQSSNSVYEVNGGTVDIENVWRIQSLNHTAGSLHAENIHSIGTSSAAAAITSTATAASGAFLSLRNVSTWVNDSVQSYVSKTGDCDFIIDGLTRNLANDVWTGTERTFKTRYDRDVIVTHTGVNYTGLLGSYLSTHLSGIDTALGLRLTGISSAGGTTLVSDGATGSLKGLTAGTGITLGASGTSVTVNTTALLALSSVTGAGTTPLVNNATTGQLRAIAAGTGMTITESAGVITFASTAGAGVSSLNSLEGAVTLAVGAGLSLTPSGQTLTLVNTGVLGLSSVGGTSLVNNATGQLKGLAAGANVTITEVAGVLTIASTGGPASGVTSFNATTGDIVFEVGSGLNLAKSGNTFTLTFTGTTGGVQSVTATTGSGVSLINDDGSVSHMAIIKRLIAGNGVTLDESATGVTVNAVGGVTSLNGRTGNTNLVGGTDIAVTVDVDGNISIAYVGSATGTKVDSINGIYGPVTLASGNPNLTITENAGTFTFTADGFLTKVENAPSADPTAMSLVADDGTSGIALIRRIIPGANVSITSDSGALTIDVTAGGGTVKSVNNILPDNPDSGNVTLGAGDVGALALVGGTMQGSINMGNNAIKNVPNPVDPGDPITLAFLSSGDIIIDNGEI